MDKTSSRIPKLSFGFRKPSKKFNSTIPEGNSPKMVGVVKEEEVPARPTKRTEPQVASENYKAATNLSRSKSLKVNRSMYYSPSNDGEAGSGGFRMRQRGEGQKLSRRLSKKVVDDMAVPSQRLRTVDNTEEEKRGRSQPPEVCAE